MSKKKEEKQKQVANAPLAGGEKTVRAYLKVKTFVGNGDEKQDEEINKFLSTIDNVTRFLNHREAYSVGKKSCIVVWYLERLKEEDETKVDSFGK